MTNAPSSHHPRTGDTIVAFSPRTGTVSHRTAKVVNGVVGFDDGDGIRFVCDAADHRWTQAGDGTWIIDHVAGLERLSAAARESVAARNAAIREAHKNGISLRRIADACGLSAQGVSNIIGR